MRFDQFAFVWVVCANDLMLFTFRNCPIRDPCNTKHSSPQESEYCPSPCSIVCDDNNEISSISSDSESIFSTKLEEIRLAAERVNSGGGDSSSSSSSGSDNSSDDGIIFTTIEPKQPQRRTTALDCVQKALDLVEQAQKKDQRTVRFSSCGESIDRVRQLLKDEREKNEEIHKLRLNAHQDEREKNEEIHKLRLSAHQDFIECAQKLKLEADTSLFKQRLANLRRNAHTYAKSPIISRRKSPWQVHSDDSDDENARMCWSRKLDHGRCHCKCCCPKF